MAGEFCPCGSAHLDVDADARRALDLIIEQAGDPLIDVNLPDGRQFRVPRRYIGFHGLQAAMVADLATRYGWMRTR